MPRVPALMLMCVLLVSAALACSGGARANGALDAKSEAEVDFLRKRLKHATLQVEAAPDSAYARDQRSQVYRKLGDAESLRKAIADLDVAIRVEQADKDKLTTFYGARASTYAELFAVTKDPATKAASIRDFDLQADASSVGFLVRGRTLCETLDEPRLGESALLESARLSGYEESYAWKDKALYKALVSCYAIIVARTQGTPGAEPYQKLHASAVAKLRAAETKPTEHSASWQAERVSSGRALRAVDEQMWRDAAAAKDRTQALEQAREARRKLLANRLQCRDCMGRGYEWRSVPSRLTDSSYRPQNSTVTVRGRTEGERGFVACHACLGRGWVERDE